MSYTFLQEQGEESSADTFSDIPQSVLSKLNLTAAKSYCKDSETESCQSSQSGTMSAHLTENLGEEKWMLSAEDSPAKTLVLQEQTVISTENREDYKAVAAAFGVRCAELLTKFNLRLLLLKTPRNCGLADLALCCETLPRWGIMLNGECLEFATSAQIISESGFLSTLPTPTCHNAKEGNYPSERTRNTKTLAAQIGGKVNPDWNEWRMGWPIGWTDLKPLGMDKFQQWQQQHSAFFQNH